VPVFGTDYPTGDGTAVRDYIHIEDLAEAHRLALDRAAAPGRAEAFNLGTGRGYSVQEVIDAARRVTGRPIAVLPGPRRPAIPRAWSPRPGWRRDARWTPRTPGLEGILETAWAHLRAAAAPRRGARTRCCPSSEACDRVRLGADLESAIPAYA